MKNFYILLLLSLSFVTAFSRSNEIQKGKETRIQSNSDLVESVIAYSTNGSQTKYSFTYDLTGNMLTSLNEKWENGQWVNSSRSNNTYDSNGKELSYLGEKWESGQWINSERRTITEDSNGNILTMLFETWETVQWIETNTVLSFQDAKGRSFRYLGYKIEVTYQGTTPVTEETNNYTLSLNCSPNPASDFTTINYTLTEHGTVSLTITNSLGIESAKIINEQKQEAGSYSVNYNTSNLTPGVYLLTIQSGNNTETKKFVVVR